MATNRACTRGNALTLRRTGKQRSNSLSYRNTNMNSNEFSKDKENIANQEIIRKGLAALAETQRSILTSRNGRSKLEDVQLQPISISSKPSKPSFRVYRDDEATEDALSENQCVLLTKLSEAKRYTGYSSSLTEDSENFDPKIKSLGNEPVSDKNEISIGMITPTSSTRHDDDYSIYGSVNGDYSVSEYHTAHAYSEKEKQEDRMICHPEYVQDIYTYMRQRELCVRPKSHYMNKQSDINPEMRTILVDWLADVTAEYELSLETLHLAVSLVDRTLSIVDCPRLKLQLVGASAIMIAAKFEEIYPPELKEFVYITDDTYTAQQILRMERVILSALRFVVCAPTSHWFAARLARKARASKCTLNTMNYVLELALLDHSYLHYRTSVLAAAAFCLANILTGPTPWSAEMEQETGVSVEEMMEVLSHLLESFRSASYSQHKAVYEKYSTAKYESVALIKAPQSLPCV